MDIRVLGPLEVRIDGAVVPLGGPAPRTVVAMLVQAVGQRVSTDALLAAIYGDDPPGGGRRTLQTYVSKLRRGFGEQLHSAAGGYVLDVDPADVDAVRFEARYRAAVGRLDEAPGPAAEMLRDALSWWRGHAYADVDAVGPIVAEVTRLHELRLAATEARLGADIALGRHDQVLGELEALVAQHPLRERFHGQRMLALYRSGRQAEALQAFGALRTRLVDELGLDPSNELRSLERRILAHDPGLRIDERRVERRAVLVTDLDPEHWDDAELRPRLQRRDEVVGRHVGGGDVLVEDHGTAVVVSLPDVGTAVDLAAMLARDTDGLRIAVDHGDVEEVDGGVSGPPVTRAARVLALGHPGQVLLTAAAQTELTASSQPGRTLTSLGSQQVSGLGEPVPLFQLEALELPGPFPPLRSGRLPPPIPVPVAESLPGHELRGQLATNSLGTLHLAYQPAVGREVAAFVIDLAVVADPGFAQRFELEAQRLARFTHAHAAGLLDHWRTPDQAVLVYRHVEGRALDEVVPAGGLPAAQASTILEQVADALDHAHERGIVHGAVAPASVRVDQRGSAWVLDLGVRQVCGSVPGAWLHELAAPEVLDGATATPRTDVYGLGLLAHHLLTGAAPPPDRALPPVRPRVDEVIARLTAPAPEDRPATAGEAVAVLQTALGQRASRPAHVVARNPYRGLEPFTELDAPDFHGRSALVAELVRTLGAQRVVTVVGPSGVGKSSLVHAGLVPAVRGGALDADVTWVVADCTPGDRALDRLTAALHGVASGPAAAIEQLLAAGGSRGLATVAEAILPPDTLLLLVVDQFEELFHGTADEQQRTRFLEQLCGLAASEAPVRAVLTLRADVFDRPLEHARFGQVMLDGLVPVRAPGPDGLAAIVRAPAEGVGVEVEPALVARVVADAEGQPGALPLVEHLLTELFDARDPQDPVLRLDDYLDAGGIHGAIGRRAERVHESLDERQRDLARRLFLQLVAVDEEGTVARRRAQRPALVGRGASAAAAEEVLDRFGASRLLTFDHEPTARVPTVELAHEALVREWDRLAGWIEDARSDLVDRHRLESRAAAWATADGDEGDLLRGSRLLAAEERLVAGRDALSTEVTALVTASRERVYREEVAARARRRRVTSALASMLAIALLLGGVAVMRWQSEATTSATARARELAAASAASLPTNVERSILLALEAVAVAWSNSDGVLPEAEEALHRAVSASRLMSRLPGIGGHVSISPDGSMVVTEGPEETGIVDIRDLTTGETLHSFVGHGASVGREAPDINGVAFSPDGSRLATAGDDGTLRIWGEIWNSGETDPELLIGDEPSVVWQPSFDRAGRLVAAAWMDDRVDGGSVRVVEVESGNVVLDRAFPFPIGVALSPDGTRLAVLDGDLGVLVIPVSDTDAVELEIGIEDNANQNGVAWSPDGRWLATIDSTDARVWDARSGELLAAATAEAQLLGIAWSSDSSRLAAGDLRGRAYVWSIAPPTARLDHEFADALSPTPGVAFSPDGERLLVGAEGVVAATTTWVWDVTATGGGEIRSFLGTDVPSAGVAFTHDRDQAVVFGSEGVVTLWDLPTGRALQEVQPTDTEGVQFAEWVNGLTTSSDGSRLGWAAGNHARGWDLDERRAMFEVVMDGPAISIALTPEGDHAAVGSLGHVRVVQTDGAMDLRWPILLSDGTESDGLETFVEFSPDGALLAVGTHVEFQPDAARVELWDWRNRELIQVIDTRQWGHIPAFSPDGSWIAVGGVEPVEIFDVETGELTGELGDGSTSTNVLAVSPDGATIATAGVDRVVRLWDASTRQMQLELPAHEGAIVALDFSRDGTRLISGDRAGNVQVWALDLEELIALAESRLTRDLTSSECLQFLGRDSCREA